MPSETYSFLDVQAAIVGPNGTFSMGNGAGPAEEGITVVQRDDKGTLSIGADGRGMHSLHAGRDGIVTVNVLKTSPVNALLSAMYNADTSSSANYGRNVISIRNPISGDTITCSGCGFRKLPDVSYSKVGTMHAWSFNCAVIDVVLGTGTPTAQ